MTRLENHTQASIQKNKFHQKLAKTNELLKSVGLCQDMQQSVISCLQCFAFSALPSVL